MDELLDVPTYFANLDFTLLTGQIVEQLKNLSASLQEFASHAGEIKEQISIQKAWWEALLPPFSGAVTGAGLAFLGNHCFQKRKERNDEKEKKKAQFGKICAALASFEDTRITLLAFKGQFLEKYKKDMKIFLLLERYYESHLDTLIGKDLENKWCSLTSPCEYFPLQNVDDRNFAEELSFIATHRAPYLIILQKLHSELLAINEQIRKRNDFVLIHMEKSIYDNTVSIKQICIAIDLHHSSCQNLNELVDSSIAFTQLAVKYLNEYAETYLSKEKLPSINCRVNKDYEKLMPPEDFHKDFDQMIQQAINASR